MHEAKDRSKYQIYQPVFHRLYTLWTVVNTWRHDTKSLAKTAGFNGSTLACATNRVKAHSVILGRYSSPTGAKSTRSDRATGRWTYTDVPVEIPFHPFSPVPTAGSIPENHTFECAQNADTR
ncbi:MAG: hypothetical protein O3B95_09885 [Chloroflexi bacterium]|nr:hypothetical protein [Chloroflexota bacterium]